MPVGWRAIETRRNGEPETVNSYVIGELVVFTGNAHPRLAEDICDYLKLPLGEAEIFKFKNDNTFVQLKQNVRSRDVFVVQTLSKPVNDHVMELLITIDAAKRASAGRITAVIPYYGYGRTDKKDQPRVPITGRLLADLITVAGADRVITVDLHAGQIQGFFNIPVDELTVMPLLVDHFIVKDVPDLVVAAADIGISKKARNVAERLNAPLAIVEKRRLGNSDRSESMTIIGDVRDKPVLTFDDEIDTGGSLVSAFQALRSAGARELYAAASHGVFSGDATRRICEQDGLMEVVITDTIPLPEEDHTSKITVLSSSDLLGEAIYRIHNGLSVGAMFTR
ncbi:MAG: ribose-phosphate diphosphokinase [Chloroflexota bacterium]